MSLRIVEFFGFAPDDKSQEALRFRDTKMCPFVEGRCIKKVDRTLVSGACTLKPTTSGAVICCPNRMYADRYWILTDIAKACFGTNARLCASRAEAKWDGFDVFVFGKKWGKELRVPNRRKKGSYFVDWVLAQVDANRNLQDFVAVELQTMDTSGSYERQVRELFGEDVSALKVKQSNMNWENVAKRILAQLIYKGHVLHREPLCTKGLFFVCPAPVYERSILSRLGGQLQTYAKPHPGTLTFRWYDLGPEVLPGNHRALVSTGQLTTTVAEVELAFTSASNLPPVGVYEQAIRSALGS